MLVIAVTRSTDRKKPLRPVIFEWPPRDRSRVRPPEHKTHGKDSLAQRAAGTCRSGEEDAFILRPAVTAGEDIRAGNDRPFGRRKYTINANRISSAAESQSSRSLGSTVTGATVAVRRPGRDGRLRPKDRRRNEPQLRPLAVVSCRFRLVRGGLSGGGSVSKRVNMTYRHLSPSNRSGSAGNGPLMTGFFFLLLKIHHTQMKDVTLNLNRPDQSTKRLNIKYYEFDTYKFCEFARKKYQSEKNRLEKIV